MKISTSASNLLLGCGATFLAFFGLADHVAGQTCVNPPSGIVSWWPGDGNALDFVDGNNGTLVGGVTFAPGEVDQAFLLNGIDGDIDTGNATNLHVSAGDFTVEAWVNFNALSHPPGSNGFRPAGDMSIVDKMSAAGVDNSDGWRLLKQDNNLFWFCLGAPGNGCSNVPTTVMSSTSPVVGTWYHVAAVKSSSNGIQLYVNGNLEAAKSLPSFIDTNSTNLLIGGNALNYAHFNGLIDEVTLYNRALSAAEIAGIFNAGSAGKCKFTPVAIEIKPGSSPPAINLSSAGVVPVAILSSPTFDATQVDPATVTLAGASVSLIGHGDKFSCSAEDVNGDGLLDLVCHVTTAQMFIQPGNSVVVLEAKTFSGQAIRGQESIQIVP